MIVFAYWEEMVQVNLDSDTAKIVIDKINEIKNISENDSDDGN